MGPTTEPLPFVSGAVDIVKLAANQFVVEPIPFYSFAARVRTASFTIHRAFYKVPFNRVALWFILDRQKFVYVDKRAFPVPLPVNPSAGISRVRLYVSSLTVAMRFSVSPLTTVGNFPVNCNLSEAFQQTLFEASLELLTLSATLLLACGWANDREWHSEWSLPVRFVVFVDALEFP